MNKTINLALEEALQILNDNSLHGLTTYPDNYKTYEELKHHCEEKNQKVNKMIGEFQKMQSWLNAVQADLKAELNESKA